jgi:hypoxanthine phosphoribosyltransferase
LIEPSYIAEVLIPEEVLQKRIADLGAEISRDYAGRDLLLLSVLKGSVVFLSDLIRRIVVPHALDFMATSSYGAQVESSGVVRILKDLDAPIEGRDVLIVEDIVDTGTTLDYLMRILRARMPNSLEICTLLNKPSRRKVEVSLKYVGFDIPNKFVIGYGLDYAELYRNLPYVAVLSESVYAGG